MEKIINALRSLIADIEDMQIKHDTKDWFEGFSVFEYDANATMAIEWPNLAISVDDAKQALHEFEAKEHVTQLELRKSNDTGKIF
jgi:hypothetical protein